MIQRGERLCFASEPRQPIRVVRKRLGEDLDRDITIQLGVTGPKDLTHVTFADGREDFVGAEPSAGGEAQVVRIIRARPLRAVVRRVPWSSITRPEAAWPCATSGSLVVCYRRTVQSATSKVKYI